MEPISEQAPCRTDTQAMRVLVVEDDQSVSSSVATALRREGYVVELASDGLEALDWLAVRSCDCIVLDVLMPGLDGLEACRRLRARGSHPAAHARAW